MKKSKRLFVDVGGYEGEASIAALDPLYAFDAVICFEPVKTCADAIGARISDPRFQIFHAALADFDGEAQLFGPGSLAGSLYADHSDVDSQTSETCQVIRASTFFRPLVDEYDEIFLKLNCEGAELAIVEDLVETGLFERIDSILLDLDAQKIPSLADRLARLQNTLSSARAKNWHLPEDVQYGWQCTYGGIRNWIRTTSPYRPTARRRLDSIKYNRALWDSGSFRGYYKFLVVKHVPSWMMRVFYSRLRSAG